jgi:hypothetical protein
MQKFLLVCLAASTTLASGWQVAVDEASGSLVASPDLIQLDGGHSIFKVGPDFTVDANNGSCVVQSIDVAASVTAADVVVTGTLTSTVTNTLIASVDDLNQQTTSLREDLQTKLDEISTKHGEDVALLRSALDAANAAHAAALGNVNAVHVADIDAANTALLVEQDKNVLLEARVALLERLAARSTEANAALKNIIKALETVTEASADDIEALQEFEKNVTAFINQTKADSGGGVNHFGKRSKVLETHWNT